MNQLFLFFISIFCCLCFTIAGCSDKDSAKPEGFPTLYPVTLLLTQEGKPLTETTVTLISENQSLKWGTSGFSDAEGKIELKTGGFVGVPVGKFKAVVTKTISEGDLNSRDEIGEVKIYTLVEKIYTDQMTSPLILDVTPETKKLTLDAGKAVKIRIN
ncbi:MAG: hypothetical protein LBU34_12210 [Planctomycetaceae bacterium]|jgi:hypothetical protein|nr:hypothetical protein [Planctomycetaceae bacterium]